MPRGVAAAWRKCGPRAAAVIRPMPQGSAIATSWLGVFPGLFIMVTVLSINFLGDALRDMLDVRETRDVT